MAKAMLIMDMPSSCKECPICASYQESAFSPREYWCPCFTEKEVNEKEKPEWCPLREVPKKKVASFKDTAYDRVEKIGYNACIDEILGGANSE